MPVVKCKGGGYKVKNVKGKCKSKKKATRQLIAVKASQSRRKKK